MPFRACAYLTRVALVAAFVIVPQRAAAVDLEPRTAAAYDRYIAEVTETFIQESGTDAFLTQGAPPALDRLRRGEILIQPGRGDGIIDVPNGLIHHWRATVFVAEVTLDEVLTVVRDYARYGSIYDWVVASDLVGREDDRLRGFFRARRRTGGVTGVVDVWMVTEYRRVGPGRATSVAKSDCVRQVEHAGESGERRLPSGTGNGYLWRADSMSKYLERDGGVYMEIDTIGLSRNYPPLLGWIIEPIARRLGRSSASDSLSQLRAALRLPPRNVARAERVMSSQSWCGT